MSRDSENLVFGAKGAWATKARSGQARLPATSLRQTRPPWPSSYRLISRPATDINPALNTDSGPRLRG